MIYINNDIHPTAIINWERVTIGKGNVIGPYVCIGTDAQHRSEQSDGVIQIGDNNTFREFTTVHLPTRISKLTKIGNNNYFMVNSHIAHDCIIEDNVTICNNVALAGHVHVMEGSNIGLGTTVHQFQVIGSYSMIGMNSTVVSSAVIQPGGKWVGNPVRNIGINEVGLSRNNVSPEYLAQEQQRFERLRSK